MRKIVSKALKTIGFTNITECKDGEQAWQTLQGGGFQLIVSDWNMPNYTGIELLSRVRKDSDLGNTPFVLLTAEAETDQVQDAVGLGVDSYIVKPFSVDTLKKKLEQTYGKVSQRVA
jgi:two-component system chemotaxis response regulator CheY